MKFTKYVLFVLAVMTLAMVLTGLTWVGTLRAIRHQHAETLVRADAMLTNQAASLSERIGQQILEFDQTLRFLVAVWEIDPRRFDLQSWRQQAVALNGISRDMILADENGRIRQCSTAEALNENIANLDFFQALADPAAAPDGLFIGAASLDGIMRQWHLNIARALHHADGSFAGVLDAEYRVSAVADAFHTAHLGRSAFLALIGTGDGKLRVAVGPTSADLDANIADTAMFKMLQPSADGIWTGPSATDAIRRIHAFREIPGRNMKIVVAVTQDEAMLPSIVWRCNAMLFAGVITGLLIVIACILIQGARRVQRRDRQSAADRAMLAASNAQLEVARAEAAAKAERLEATLTGMADGVSMIDAHMCLVEWNGRFPEIAGVPAGLLRIGLPMEEILHAQIATGQFGAVADPAAEVQRRIARLRTAPFGVTQRLRPDGRTLELRRNRLPDGGFVTLYSDITEHKRVEEALRQARAEAEAANTTRSAFMAMVSHEIRTPLNALLNTIRLLSDSVLTPAQASLVGLARQSGDALFGLINDILEMTRAEAGQTSIRPSLFELRPLLESSVELMSAPAAERGITFRLRVDATVPAILLTDPSRLRQVLLNLLSNAAKYATAGDVWVTAEQTGDAAQPVRITVRDPGPCIAAPARERLFRPFSRLDSADTEATGGTGLGLSISRHLITLMGGAIGCDTWADAAGAGNAFWLTLPSTALPCCDPTPDAASNTAAISDREVPFASIALRRGLPRTRILLVEDVAANQYVTATLLRRQGHCVDVMASGPAAIRAIQITPYDLVFMDIFMPGMSGMEATQIIRSLPEPARSTPVVALTAYVGPEDEILFRASGMSGILGKPVALKEMLETIRTRVWQPHPGPADLASGASRPHRREATAEPALANERIAELRSNLPPNTFAELVEECILDLDHRLPALRRALAAGVPGAITAHAHSMAGLAAGYGMAALEAKLRRILDAVRQNALASLDRNTITEIETDFAAAKIMLREIVYQYRAVLPSPTE